jgi:hypothetical protein
MYHIFVAVYIHNAAHVADINELFVEFLNNILACLSGGPQLTIVANMTFAYNFEPPYPSA